MSKFNMKAALDALYICCCALSGERASEERLVEIDLAALYAISRFHSLTALTCEGLQRSDYEVVPEKQKWMTAFITAKEKSVRKNLMLDTERIRLLNFMEQQGIWYMPLKGAILKEMYPKMGLRQMADNDILFDEKYRATIRDWFSLQGYTGQIYETDNHDVYRKEPVYNFEMHVSLYGETHRPEWRNYYRSVKDRLVKDCGNQYGYHFRDEDFYVYFLTHGFKHFDGNGTGLRFLFDLYIYLKEKQKTMDWVHVARELEKLELSAFEKNCRELVIALFADVHAFDMEKLPAEQREMLIDFLSSGTYGTMEKRIKQNIVSYGGKWKYMLWRIFPGSKVLAAYHPLFEHKWLLPIGWLYRAVKIVSSGSKSVIRELSIVAKSKRN